MNLTRTRAFALVMIALGALSPRTAFADFFIRPGAWYVDHDASSFASQTAPAFEAGAVLGSAQRHALSIEAARLPWELDVPLASFAPALLFGISGDGKMTPLLASYRYYFAAKTARWRIYAGASAGMTKVTGRIATRLSGIAYGGDVHRWAATYAGTLAVSMTVTPSFSIDLGYRYLQFADVDYTTVMFVGIGGFSGPAGPKQNFGATKAHVTSLSLTLRF